MSLHEPHVDCIHSKGARFHNTTTVNDPLIGKYLTNTNFFTDSNCNVAIDSRFLPLGSALPSACRPSRWLFKLDAVLQ